MPRLISETTGGGDLSWLGSTHGLRNARTVVVNVSAFTAGTHYPDGYLKSGTPVAIVGGKAVPYDATEATTAGAGVLAGFILTDQKIVGTTDLPAPLLDHGRVKVANLPIAFAKPAAAAKLSATTIVFV
jgi:hypothetical protein